MTSARVLGIETHQFAPELNRVHLANGVRIRAPGITSVAEYRKELVGIAWTPVIMAEVSTLYPTAQSWLQRTYRGSVKTRAQALEFRRKVESMLAPGGKAVVRTWITGA